MRFQRLLLLLFAAALTAGTASATPVILLLSAHDHGVVSIDGNAVITWNGPGTSDPLVSFAALDLANGWHGISIDYTNTTGSPGLTLYDAYSLPPLLEVNNSLILQRPVLQSLDASGNPINGLRGDYFHLDGTPLTTWGYPHGVGEWVPLVTYGEGPIQDGSGLYNGSPGVWGPGTPYFNQKLTGQIYVGPETNPPLGQADAPPSGDTPEAGTWVLMAAALPLLVFSRLRLTSVTART